MSILHSISASASSKMLPTTSNTDSHLTPQTFVPGQFNVTDSGRVAENGFRVWKLERDGGASYATNLSGDFDSQSADGKWITSFDATANEHWAINVETLEKKSLGSNVNAGGNIRNTIWHKTQNAIWKVTSTELQLVDLDGVVLTTVALPALPATPQGPVTSNEWRTGTKGTDRGILWTVSQPGISSPSGYQSFIQSFDLDTGAMSDAGFWLNAKQLDAERVHNLHPGSDRFFTYTSPNSSLLYTSDWSGNGWTLLTPPVGPEWVHITIHGTKCAYSEDDNIRCYDLTNPSSPVLIREILGLGNIINGGNYTQYMHGVLGADGILLFSAAQLVSTVQTQIGIFKTNINNTSAPIEKVVSVGGVLSPGSFNYSMRPAGRSYVAWTEGTSISDRRAYFCKV